MSTRIVIDYITPLSDNSSAMSVSTEVVTTEGLNLTKYLTDLADYPSYENNARKYLQVNASANGVLWSDVDATLFGGKAQSSFIFGDNSRGTTSWNTGANNILKSGFYYINTDYTGLPQNAAGHLFHIQGSTDDYAVQKYKAAGFVDNEYIREKNGGTWQPWREINSGTNQFATKRSEFDYLIESNRRKYSGSGPTEWGKHRNDGNTYVNVNEGMYCVNTVANSFGIGRTSSASGISRTYESILNVDGRQINLMNNGYGDGSTFKVELPPAEDGTRTLNQTTGAVTIHADSNVAFDYLTSNHDFRNGGDGWDIGDPSRGTVTYTNGQAILNDTIDDVPGLYIQHDVALVAGQVYEAEFSLDSINGGSVDNFVRDADGVTPFYFETTSEAGTYKVKFTAQTTGNGYIILYAPANAGDATYNHAFVKLEAENVITSRKDYVMIEVWDEVVTDKNIVAPFGNVQYGASTFDGITLTQISNLGIDQKYSAFGDWDDVTDGFVINWAVASRAEKRRLLKLFKDNIRVDDETGDLIQTRYRVRSIRGLGNDWEYIGASSVVGNWRYKWPQNTIIPRGKSETFTDLASSNLGIYQTGSGKLSEVTIGHAEALSSGEAPNVAFGHEGKCFAIPVALISRLTQAAYHPIHCPEGTQLFTQQGVIGIGKWYEHQPFFNVSSKAECYKIPTQANEVGRNQATGNISDGRTGRDDNDVYKFYDAIYDGQVKDLRLSANKQNENKLRIDGEHKAIGGTKRGVGRLPYLNNAITATTTTSGHDGFRTYIGFPKNTIKNETGLLNSTELNGRIIINSNVYETVFWRTADATYDYIYLHPKYGNISSGLNGLSCSGCSHYYMEEEYDKLPYVNIIGDPIEINNTFPDGLLAEWLPVIPTGGLLEFTHTRKSNGKPSSFIYTDDGGNTWTNDATFPPTFDEVKNGYTTSLASGAVVLSSFESLSDFTQPSTVKSHIGDTGDVIAICWNDPLQGNRLMPSVIGEIAKSANHIARKRYAITSHYEDSTGKLEQPTPLYTTEHTPITLGAPSNDSKGVKVLTTLIEEDGLLYEQWHAIELIWDTDAADASSFTNIIESDVTPKNATEYYHVTDGVFRGYWQCINNTSTAFSRVEWTEVGDELVWADGLPSFRRWKLISAWGDDNIIDIADNETSKINRNGSIVKVVTHRSQLPVGIANSNDSSQAV